MYGIFGCIALYHWNRNLHYHDLLLSTLPSPCHAALDVGCGDGTLVRRLAERAETVVGIDISKDMIEQAERVPNVGVSLIHDDFLGHDFGDQRFGFITSVAALHHMDFRKTVERMKSLLHPNGVIAIVGLARTSSLRDVAFDAAGFFATRIGPLRRKAHNPGAPLAEPTMTYTGVERSASAILPGAAFRRLLLFRYLLTWKKPPD